MWAEIKISASAAAFEAVKPLIDAAKTTSMYSEVNEDGLAFDVRTEGDSVIVQLLGLAPKDELRDFPTIPAEVLGAL
jgi:hypothetical protein